MNSIKRHQSYKKNTNFLFNYLWLIGEIMLISLISKELDFNQFGDIKYAVIYGFFGLAYYEMAWSGETFYQASVILATAAIQFLFQLNGHLLFTYLLPIALLTLGIIRIRVSSLEIDHLSIKLCCFFTKTNEIDISRLDEMTSSQTWVGKKLNFGSLHIPVVNESDLQVISGFSDVDQLLSCIKNQIK